MIFKKGDSTDTENYRGITLINTLAKVYTKILAKRLANINKEHRLIRNEQIGFIEGEQALGAVTSVIEICQRRKLKGTNTLLSFIDFRKAYDLVSHERQFDKLKDKGLGPKFIESIKSLYKGTNLRVRCGNAISEPFTYNRGVRQGCPTSPLLFDLYIDDLFDKIQNIRIPSTTYKIPRICYADDTLIIATTEREIKRIRKMEQRECNGNKC